MVFCQDLLSFLPSVEINGYIWIYECVSVQLCLSKIYLQISLVGTENIPTKEKEVFPLKVALEGIIALIPGLLETC